MHRKGQRIKWFYSGSGLITGGNSIHFEMSGPWKVSSYNGSGLIMREDFTKFYKIKVREYVLNS